MPTWCSVLIGILSGSVLVWVGLVVALAVFRPKGVSFREAVHVLPDLLRLLPQLARDRSLPRGVRLRLWLLLIYLASPIDLIPDFIPVVGYADDAIVVALVLRSTVRAAGLEAIRAHWTGTDDGFRQLRQLTGMTEDPGPS